jgi:4-hydroxy-2-oxoheptanedioate aldolase
MLNANILVIPMIEELEAVDNLNEIAGLDGVDILHVAPGDLAQSMGNASVEDVREVMDKVIPKIRNSGKWAGVGGNSPDDISRISDLIGLGANFVTIGAAAMLISAAQNFKADVMDRIR